MWHGRSRVARDPRGRPGAAPSSSPRPRAPATDTTFTAAVLRTPATTSSTALRALCIAPLVLLALACEELPRTYSSAGPAQLLFADRFDGAELGPSWKSTGPGARLEGGELVVEGLRNHPLWLTLPLPDNVRVEFDARAATDEGDIKVELAGDGKSFARSASYTATGYVVVFGGWNNTTSAIVRRDEHGGDRKTTQSIKVEAGKRYHFAITRRDGAIQWELDGQEALAYDDPEPLTGPAQRHFAFGGWEARVAFDNLEVFAL